MNNEQYLAYFEILHAIHLTFTVNKLVQNEDIRVFDFVDQGGLAKWMTLVVTTT